MNQCPIFLDMVHVINQTIPLKGDSFFKVALVVNAKYAFAD